MLRIKSRFLVFCLFKSSTTAAMAPECLGATKKEGGSNVRVSMAMAVPVTPRGGRRVKGHGLQHKVQLSLWRPRHLAEVKSYIHRKKKRRKGWGGGGKLGRPISLHSERRRRRRKELVSYHVIYRNEMKYKFKKKSIFPPVT